MKLEKSKIKSIKITIYECLGGHAVKGRGKVIRVYEVELEQVISEIQSTLESWAESDRDNAGRP